MNRPRLAMTLAISAAVIGIMPTVAVAQDASQVPIEGPVWDLIVPDDRLTGTGATLSLVEGTATVHGGCNTFFGPYELDGGSLSFGDLAGTMIACGATESEVEDYFLGALGGVAAFDLLDDGTLQLLDAEGTAVLTFSEEVVATANDLGQIEFEIERMRGHIAELRGRIAAHDNRDQVAALEAHLNELTKQHIHQRDLQEQLRKRVRALEHQVAILTEIHVEDGDIPMGDTP